MPAPTYTYTPGIPNATDQLKNSQPTIQANFQSIGQVFDANHADFNSDTYGQHNLVQMPEQVSAPNPPFADTDVAFYNLESDVTDISEIFVHLSTGSFIEEDYPMTASILSTTDANWATGSGWSYLPSGLIMKWGTGTATSPVTKTSYPVAANIPVFTTATLNVNITATSNSGTYVASLYNLSGYTPSTTGFYATPSGAISVTFVYLAIGY
jgi:hypothetical protein